MLEGMSLSGDPCGLQGTGNGSEQGVQAHLRCLTAITTGTCQAKSLRSPVVDLKLLGLANFLIQPPPSLRAELAVGLLLELTGLSPGKHIGKTFKVTVQVPQGGRTGGVGRMMMGGRRSTGSSEGVITCSG